MKERYANMFIKEKMKKLSLGLFVAATCMSMSIIPTLAENEPKMLNTSTFESTGEKYSTFTISIPKNITIESDMDSINYQIGVKGDIASNKYISITPSNSITFDDTSGAIIKKSSVVGTVTQEVTELQYDKINTSDFTLLDGSVTAKLSAGKWRGTVEFTVSLNDLAPGVYDSNGVMTMNWDELLNNEVLYVNDGVLTSNYNSTSDNNSSSEILVGKLVIPDNVTSIGNSGLRFCKKLIYVELPDSLTSIDSRAFSNCYLLANVVIPNSVSYIGSLAFINCSSITNIKIPNGITSIEEYTFQNCPYLTSLEIPDSVTSIKVSSFYLCNRLTKITIPDGVTTIGTNAFGSCTSLTSIEIPNSITSIGDRAMFNDNCDDMPQEFVKFYNNSLSLGHQIDASEKTDEYLQLYESIQAELNKPVYK